MTTLVDNKRQKRKLKDAAKYRALKKDSNKTSPLRGAKKGRQTAGFLLKGSRHERGDDNKQCTAGGKAYNSFPSKSLISF